MDATAFWLTLKLGACTTLVLLAIGVPVAYWLATATNRMTAVVAKAAVALPLLLPPSVLGFYLLVAMGPNGPLGQLTKAVAGRKLAFTFEGLIVACAIHSLPFMVQPVVTALGAIDWRLIEAAQTLGAGSWRIFWRIALPLAWPGVLAGTVLTFAHTMGEFGVVLMVGGAIPGETRTLSIAILEDVQSMNYSAAAEASGVLLAVSFVVMVGLMLQSSSPKFAKSNVNRH